MTKFAQPMRLLALCLLTIAIAIPASAQGYTELLSFNGNSAAGPKTPLTQGLDGSLYGMTNYGGTGTCFDGSGIGCGVVFKITNGKLRVIYSFQLAGPIYPGNDLVLGHDGNFYGTVLGGYGAIFKITPSGGLTTLHTFTLSDGASPLGGVIQAADGNFYGTTSGGGMPSTFCPNGCGTVFKMTPAGVLTTLYSFCPHNYCPDGDYPEGPLVQGIDGSFYGTTYHGGLYKAGTIFKIRPDGTFKLLYAFNNENSNPGGLILGTDGNFYGTTSDYGYRITPEGVFSILSYYGSGYYANLPIQGNDGNLYGTTFYGGMSGYGLIFEMPTDGTASTLYSFAGYPDDGSSPLSSLVQATDGKFYGTTYAGGHSPCNYYSAGCGTVFSYDAGLGPFVALVRGTARVGERFGLLGQGLTDTASVSLNGTPANFTVTSDTSLIATVPAGATSGYVTVTTPSGTLTTNALFYVRP
jgi:uncharacterized repeat protein (TIGR03803 family)